MSAGVMTGKAMAIADLRRIPGVGPSIASDLYGNKVRFFAFG